MKRITLVSVLLLGCTNLPLLSDDVVCGNLALDVDEDCDGVSQAGEGTECASPGDDNECHFVCDSGDPDAAVCPDRWVCGKDKRCREPTGTFAEADTSPYRFPVQDFVIGDLDGDGFADLIGNGEATLTARFGDSDASFVGELNDVLLTGSGGVAYTDLNQDGKTDVVVPLIDSLYSLLGDASRTLQPVAYSLFADAPLGPLKIYAAEGIDFYDVMVGIAQNACGRQVIRPDLSFEGCVDGGDEIGPRSIETVDGLTADAITGPLRQGLADDGSTMIFAIPFGGASSVEVLKLVRAGPQAPWIPESYDVVELPAGVTVTGNLFFGRAFGGDAIDDLVVEVLDGGVHRYALAAGSAGEFLAPTVMDFAGIALGIPGPGQCVAAGGEWMETFCQVGMSRLLAWSDIDGDGFADYVAPEGLFMTGNILPLTAVLSPFDWQAAEVADFNRDGRVDVVTSTRDADAIFLHLNAGDDPITFFNTFVTTTEQNPQDFVIGDFDGDLITDAGYIERDLLGGLGDQVSVAFGSSDGPFTQVVRMAEFDTINQFAKGQLRAAALGSLLDDIFLVGTDESGEEPTLVLSILSGSTSRRMISPMLIFGEGNDIQQTRLAVGSFAPDGTASDIVAVGAGGLLAPPLFRLLVGRDRGQFEVRDVAYSVGGGDFRFNARCARWATTDLDAVSATAHEISEIIGFDSSEDCQNLGSTGPIAMEPRLLVGRLQTEGSVTTLDAGAQPCSVDRPCLTLEDLALPESPGVTLSAVAGVSPVDADLDGDPDLLASFRSAERADVAVAGGGAGVYWNDQGALVSPSPFTSDLGIRAVFTQDLDLDGLPELLIFTEQGVGFSRLDPATFQYNQAAEVLFNFEGGEQLRVGDLNSDGLDDLAITVGSQVFVFLAQPKPPCGARPEGEACSFGGEPSAPDAGGE